MVYVQPVLAAVAPRAPVAETTDEIAEDLVAQIRTRPNGSRGYSRSAGSSTRSPAIRTTAWCRRPTNSKADAVVVGASEQAGHRIVGSVAVRLVKAGRWPVTVVP
ncbi:universal stress protein A [Streptomyces purpurascens]